jgi:hypothetical protein
MRSLSGGILTLFLLLAFCVSAMAQVPTKIVFAGVATKSLVNEPVKKIDTELPARLTEAGMDVTYGIPVQAALIGLGVTYNKHGQAVTEDGQPLVIDKAFMKALQAKFPDSPIVVLNDYNLNSVRQLPKGVETKGEVNVYLYNATTDNYMAFCIAVNKGESDLSAVGRSLSFVTGALALTQVLKFSGVTAGTSVTIGSALILISAVTEQKDSQQCKVIGKANDIMVRVIPAFIAGEDVTKAEQ